MDGDMDVIDVIFIALTGLWLFLPAMLPNSAAVLFGGGTPVDFGRSWKGRRILGDGKTWKGLIGGVAAGITLGICQMGTASYFGSENLWGFGTFESGLVIIIALAVGALFGDMLGSFVKRRLNLERGAKAPILDQYDFFIGAFLVVGIINLGWLYDQYFQGWQLMALIFVLFITPVLHRVVNIIGYKLGQKDVPW